MACIFPREIDHVQVPWIEASIEAPMSLVSGPGRGGAAGKELPGELRLHVEQHVRYIQRLDTVRSTRPVQADSFVMLIP